MKMIKSKLIERRDIRSFLANMIKIQTQDNKLMIILLVKINEESNNSYKSGNRTKLRSTNKQTKFDVKKKKLRKNSYKMMSIQCYKFNCNGLNKKKKGKRWKGKWKERKMINKY